MIKIVNNNDRGNMFFTQKAIRSNIDVITKIEQTIIVVAPVIVALAHIYAPSLDIAIYVDEGVVVATSILEYIKLFLKRKVFNIDKVINN